jgi:hypothetical protein
MGDGSDLAFGLLLLILVGAVVYFIPTMIAFNNKHSYKWIIFCLNLFLGATGIVWIVVLIWAIFPKDKSLVSPIVSPTGSSNIGQHIGNAVSEAKVSGGDMMSDLKKIAELKECGAITEEEFQKMKKDALEKHGKQLN